MGWKRIQIQLIPSSWILPFFSPFMFVVELRTKAVKIKKRKCFLNSNDFENKTNATPALIVTHRKEKKISLSKTFYSHDHTMEAIILFIVVTSTWCKYQTEILNNAWNCYFRFTLQLLACLASPEATPPPYIVQSGSGMSFILIISIFFKGCYLLILSLSDKLLLRALLSLSMFQESKERSKLFDGIT